MIKQSLLSVRELTMEYKTKKGWVSAIDNVSFDLPKGQSMGLVGESGCGKTSIAMTLMDLLPDNASLDRGQILLDGKDLVPMMGWGAEPRKESDPLKRKIRHRQRGDTQIQSIRWKRISMVFQAAMNALDPVYRVGDQIIESIVRHEPNIQPNVARERVTKLFQLVGIDPKMIDRYPHEFSGGMRQRAVIAMSLSCNPDLIIADEPTTALDVIVQDQVLRELRKIQKQLNMSMIYISHDIAVIAEVAELLAVMYAGRMVELSSSHDIFKRPMHPYTVALMSAFPSIRGPKHKLEALPGEPPDLLYPPKGCRFHPRCPRALAQCKKEQPPFEDAGGGHMVACWNPAEVA
jgi:peptide/nickel transport system ATP-binding protein